MLYHFTSRERWERIAADGEIKALSPPGSDLQPKVVHLTIEDSARGLPPSVATEVMISVRDELLRATSFLEWWSFEVPLDVQAQYEADIHAALGWPTRPEVHWYVVKGAVPARFWVEVRSRVDGARLWP